MKPADMLQDPPAPELEFSARMESCRDSLAGIRQWAINTAGADGQQLLEELQAIAQRNPATAMLMAAAAGHALGGIAMRRGCAETLAADGPGANALPLVVKHFTHLMQCAAGTMLHDSVDAMADALQSGGPPAIWAGIGAHWAVQATTWGKK